MLGNDHLQSDTNAKAASLIPTEITIIKINEHLYSYLHTLIISDVTFNNSSKHNKYSASDESRMELDSHASMPVVGKNAHILSNTGRTCDVKAYNPDYEAMVIPLVDAAVQYDCPFTGNVYILVLRNALYVPAMDNHLIPPFIMREAGITVNATPKIHTDDPSVSDHCIIFKNNDFKIPMSLYGIFSYFKTTKPTLETLQESEDIYMLTPSVWDPYNSAY